MKRRTIQTPNPTHVGAVAGIHWGNILLWTLQVLLALLFGFAGIAKLMMPIGMLAAQTGLPGVFIRFIAVSELMGALGLVLPGRFGIHSDLRPLAAVGLVIIMIGATVMTAATQGLAPAAFPLIVGSFLVMVIRARWQSAERHSR